MSFVAFAAIPASALAWSPPGEPRPASAPPGTPALISNMTQAPSGYHMLPSQVLNDAKANVAVRAQLKRMPNLTAYVYTRGNSVWQVSWFTPTTIKSHPQWEEIQAYVDDNTQQVTQVWTGYQVAWTMARGYPDAFGKAVNRVWIWLPLCVLFIAPFLVWRRRPSLLHLDLVVLLAFSVSLAWFNHSNLGLSVPSVYPFMIYLMARLVGLAFGRGVPKGPLRIVLPTPVLAILLVFLVGFRVGLNITDSNVIDVGYAGTIGAYKILHGQQMYGHYPSSNAAGDTYGPFNYFAYVPAVAVAGWSGNWDSLPASHIAAIMFDLLTMVALFFLGRRIRGPSFGILLAYLWAAFPFTLYTLSSNSNDSLVALMTVVALLAITSAPGRGVAAAFAGLTKFGPFILAPLLLRGTGEYPPPWERAFWTRTSAFVAGFVIAVFALLALVIFKHDWHYFYQDTICYQAGQPAPGCHQPGRPAPFSIWGLWGNTFGGLQSALKHEQTVWEALTVIGAVLVMFFPRGKRELWQVAALGGALMIAVECCLTYWFYLYIPWFFALTIVGLILVYTKVEPVFGEEPVGWAEAGVAVAGPGPSAGASPPPPVFDGVPVPAGTRLAEPGPRAWAYLMDWAAYLILLVILELILKVPGVVIALVLVWIYHIVCISQWGQTVGMRVFEVRVVSAGTGRPLGYAQGILRQILAGVSGVVFAYGYWRAFIVADRRTWHDQWVDAVAITTSAGDPAGPSVRDRAAV